MTAQPIAMQCNAMQCSIRIELPAQIIASLPSETYVDGTDNFMQGYGCNVCMQIIVMEFDGHLNRLNREPQAAKQKFI